MVTKAGSESSSSVAFIPSFGVPVPFPSTKSSASELTKPPASLDEILSGLLSISKRFKAFVALLLISALFTKGPVKAEGKTFNTNSIEVFAPGKIGPGMLNLGFPETNDHPRLCEVLRLIPVGI